MKQTYTRLIVVPVKIDVEFQEDEGFYYARIPTCQDDSHRRPSIVTVRSADKETAIEEALRQAGYGAPARKTA
jgi:hypothetical protein